MASSVSGNRIESSIVRDLSLLQCKCHLFGNPSIVLYLSLSPLLAAWGRDKRVSRKSIFSIRSRAASLSLELHHGPLTIGNP